MERALPDICKIQYGFAFDSAKFSDSEGIPLIRIRDVLRGFSETYTTEKCNSEYVVNNGDMLIGMDGEFNIAHWNGGKAYLNQRVCKLIPTAEVDALYLYYFMPKALKSIEEKTPFVTVKHLSAKELNKIVVPLPMMDEQKRIAGCLEKIDGLIALRKQQLSKLDELVKARFVELFGHLNGNKKGFDIVAIEELCTIIKDGTHQTPTYTEDTQNGFKFLSSKDVMTQKICWDDIKYIPAELHERLYATIQPQRNDILMSKNGVNYGVAAVNDTDEVFDIYVSLALLRPKTDMVNPVYLRCVINNPDTKRQFDSSIKGIGVPNLHLGEIKKTKVLLPPMENQIEFVSFVEQTDKSKLAIQQSLEKLETLKKSLMQKYFG